MKLFIPTQSSFGPVPPQMPPGAPPGAPPFGGGGQAPPQQQAPPNEPPVDEGGGGGGGGGDAAFPHIPPTPGNQNRQPYVIHNTSSAPVTIPTYAICMMGAWREQFHPTLMPPPAALGLYIYPIQYYEIQTRQYFYPPAMHLQSPTPDMPDHDASYFRDKGWKAGPYLQERFPMFNMDNRMVGFHPTWTTRPMLAVRWLLVSTDPVGILHVNPTEKVHQTIEALRLFFLTPPPWMTDSAVRIKYEQAQLPGIVPIYCKTGNWPSDTYSPTDLFGFPFSHDGQPDFDEFDDEDDFEDDYDFDPNNN